MAKKEKQDLKTLSRDYAALYAEQKALDLRLEAMKVVIKEEMAKAGADKIETNFGGFTVSKRTTYKYSPAIDAMKKEEEEKGIAVATVSESLRFTPVKIKNG